MALSGSVNFEFISPYTASVTEITDYNVKGYLATRFNDIYTSGSRNQNMNNLNDLWGRTTNDVHFVTMNPVDSGSP